MAKHPSDISVHTIQAAVLRKRGGPLKIESLEMEGPREDEILVRIVASGICHTDIGFCDDWDEEPTAQWCWAMRAQAWWRRWEEA